MSCKQRVVIEIDEDIRAGDTEQFRNMLDVPSVMPAVSAKSLKMPIYAKLHSPTQTLRFDCVGTARNSFVRAEFAMLMDELFLKKSKCCLLQFFPLRDCQLSFLCNLLVSEVDKRMMIMQAKLFAIKMEYYDLRKYDVINLLGDGSQRSTIKNKRKSYPHIIFHSTTELLRWLQTKYIQLFARGQGTENIDCEFTFCDIKNNVYTVRLSIMNNFLCHMDGDMKTCLRNCFENIHSTERRRKHVMLTDCLREIFKPTENWYTWFIFHVPIARGRGVVIDDQLNLATAAYAGINAKLPAYENTQDDFDLGSLLSFWNAPSESDVAISSEASNKRRESAASIVMTQNASLLLAATSSRTLSNRWPTTTKTKQMNDLNFWYSKMDQLVPEVLKQIDAYYECKYRDNIQKICNELKNMLQFGSVRLSNTSCGLSAKVKRDASLDRLKRCYEMALVEFMRLAKDIENSVDYSALRVYVEAKKNEIKEFATNCKLRHLEMCQNCLIDTIKNERSYLATKGKSVDVIKNPSFKKTISGSA
ncbi:uncharacterized protein LOC128855714 [Anastrepha ludens]|uniref:uncharacterized protein LOC128855714 n=1 Tax=Anastrepha ludens TaxID=28586 RepID=UPI0023AEB305|nr:uncharacterized protein LOC128855714 [Anastrepha ludens]